eukprot:COSAG01_NODE_16838_length_1200_cov_1.107175_1_plen_135_part_00
MSAGPTRSPRPRQGPRAEAAALQQAATAAAAVGMQPARPELAVGARLRFFVLAWMVLIADPWCTSVVKHGYYPEMTWHNFQPRAARPRAASMLDPVKEAARRQMVVDKGRLPTPRRDSHSALRPRCSAPGRGRA